MKKIVRLTAVVLVLAMCLCMAAGAAEDKVKADENSLATIYGCNGATVTFATDGDKEEKISVTYTDPAAIREGAFYLVMVLTGVEDEATGEVSYTPTKDSILYIDQTTGSAAGSVSFEVYPSAIADSAILIYGTDINGEADSLIAAVIEGKYMIGDVTGDGKVSSLDALLILQSLVGKATLNDTQKLAGNVDGNGTEPGSLDALKILQYLVGKATL